MAFAANQAATPDETLFTRFQIIQKCAARRTDKSNAVTQAVTQAGAFTQAGAIITQAKD